MSKFFIDDRTPFEDTEEDLDLQTCLASPRVTKVTILPDGTLIAELGPEEVSSPDVFLKHSDRATGFRGVTQRGDKWRVRVSHGGVERSVGTFDSMREAVEARMKAERGL